MNNPIYKFETINGEFAFVKLPKNKEFSKYRSRSSNYHAIRIENGFPLNDSLIQIDSDFDIINFTVNLTEEQWCQILDMKFHDGGDFTANCYIHHSNDEKYYYFDNATQSGFSLLKKLLNEDCDFLVIKFK